MYVCMYNDCAGVLYFMHTKNVGLGQSKRCNIHNLVSFTPSRAKYAIYAIPTLFELQPSLLNMADYHKSFNLLKFNYESKGHILKCAHICLTSEVLSLKQNYRLS